MQNRVPMTDEQRRAMFARMRAAGGARASTVPAVGSSGSEDPQTLEIRKAVLTTAPTGTHAVSTAGGWTVTSADRKAAKAASEKALSDSISRSPFSIAVTHFSSAVGSISGSASGLTDPLEKLLGDATKTGPLTKALQDFSTYMQSASPDVTPTTTAGHAAAIIGGAIPYAAGGELAGSSSIVQKAVASLGRLGAAISSWKTPVVSGLAALGIGKYRDKNPTMDPRTEKALAIAQQISGYVSAISGIGATKYSANILATKSVNRVSSLLQSLGSAISTVGKKAASHLPDRLASQIARLHEAYTTVSDITRSSLTALRGVPKLAGKHAEAKQNLALARAYEQQAQHLSELAAHPVPPVARDVSTFDQYDRLAELTKAADDLFAQSVKRTGWARRTYEAAVASAKPFRDQAAAIESEAAKKAARLLAQAGESASQQARSLDEMKRIAVEIKNEATTQLYTSHRMARDFQPSAAAHYKFSAEMWRTVDANVRRAVASAAEARGVSAADARHIADLLATSEHNAAQLRDRALQIEMKAATELASSEKTAQQEAAKAVADAKDARNAAYAYNPPSPIAATPHPYISSDLKTAASSAQKTADELSAEAVRLTAEVRKTALTAGLVTSAMAAKLASEESKIADYQNQMETAYAGGMPFVLSAEQPRTPLATAAVAAVGTLGLPLTRQFRYGADSYVAQVANYRAQYDMIGRAEQSGEISPAEANAQRQAIADTQKPRNMAGKSVWTVAPAAAAFLSWQAQQIADILSRTSIDTVKPGAYMDGDTVNLTQHSGGNSIRLLDINAPEVAHASANDPKHPERTAGELFGEAATAYARSLLPDGQTVRVVLDSHKKASGKEVHGRQLASLETLPAPFDKLLSIPVVGKLIPANEFQTQMIRAGLADIHYRALSGPTDVQAAHDAARAFAKAAGQNIWTPEGRAALPWVGTEKTRAEVIAKKNAARATAADNAGLPQPPVPPTADSLSTSKEPLAFLLMAAANTGLYGAVGPAATPVAQAIHTTVSAVAAQDYNTKAAMNPDPLVFRPPSALKTDYEKHAEAVLKKHRKKKTAE